MSTPTTTSAHPLRAIFKFFAALVSIASFLAGIYFMVYGLVTGGFTGFVLYGLLFPGTELLLLGSIFAHVAGIAPSQVRADEAAAKNSGEKP